MSRLVTISIIIEDEEQGQKCQATFTDYGMIKLDGTAFRRDLKMIDEITKIVADHNRQSKQIERGEGEGGRGKR